MALVLVLGLVACGEQTGPDDPDALPGTEHDVSSGTAGGSSDSSEENKEEEWKPGTEPNLVMACDQYNERIVVYDMARVGEEGNLDQAEVVVIENARTAGLKYREDTVYGDVIIYSAANMVSYPEGEMIWQAPSGRAGSNPHSIEILPSGNIVTASSTDGRVTIFNTYANLKEGATLKTSAYDLPGAHGVLWDPEYELLWAVGDYDLVAYRVKVEDGDEVLRQVGGVGGKIPTKWGHDLAADLTDTRYLWFTTGESVYRFDKEENVFIEKYDQYAKLGKANVKGFGNNKNNNFFFCIPNHGKGRAWEKEGLADWCTDTICYAYWKSEHFLYVQECVSEKAAFYKVRVMYGQYQ